MNSDVGSESDVASTIESLLGFNERLSTLATSVTSRTGTLSSRDLSNHPDASGSPRYDFLKEMKFIAPGDRSDEIANEINEAVQDGRIEFNDDDDDDEDPYGFIPRSSNDRINPLSLLFYCPRSAGTQGSNKRSLESTSPEHTPRKLRTFRRANANDQGSEEQEDENRDEKPPDRKRSRTLIDNFQKQFACPYVKRNPRSARKTCLKGFQDLKQVK